MKSDIYKSSSNSIVIVVVEDSKREWAVCVEYVI